MSVQKPVYGFGDLPLADVDSGTNILVTGPALGGIRTLVMRMLLCRRSDEGALFIAADTDGQQTLSDYEAAGGAVDPRRVGVVDCTEEGTADESHNVVSVGSPSDLTGVGIEFSNLYERLVAGGATNVRTGVYTLGPFVMYADAKTVYRFLHTLTGRIRTADGLGVCAIDPGTVDRQTLSSLAQAFDGRLELAREDEEIRVRTAGLADQPDGWRPIDL
jgi:hypothetical protein